MPRSIPSLFLFLLLAAAAIGIVPALLMFRQYLPFSGGFHGLPSDRMAPDFELIDSSGKAVHLSDIDGYRYLFFGFSRCQTVCPAHWGELRRLQSHFAGTSAPKIIFISVDSAYDTPQRLRERFADFGPHFIALTGQSAAIQKVSAQYHILAPQGSAEAMHHSATLFLLRPDGRIALIYPNPTDEKTLLADLRRLGF